MNLLHVSPSFFPATFFGGPTYALLGLCNYLAATPGVSLKVLTTNTSGDSARDVLDRPSHTQFEYPVHYASKIAATSVSLQFLCRLREMVNCADLVHLSAVYSFPTIPTLILCRILKKPLVWTMHGALMRRPGTRNQALKFLWEKICDRLLAPGRCVLHASSELEASAIKLRMKGAPVVCVPFGVDMPASISRVAVDGHRSAVFIGRLHPIKGLDRLIEAWALVRPKNWRLVIAGPLGGGYSDRLKQLALDAGLTNDVSFIGKVDNEEKWQLLAQASLFVLPSLSENFGLSLAEALAAGVPAIATRGTPWRELQTEQCGWWTQGDSQSIAQALKEATSLQDVELRAMGLRARALVERKYSWPQIANQMIQAYQWLLGGPRPNDIF